MNVGDWVQATEEITEDNFPEDGETHVHAEKGGVGHVLELLEECVFVFWERTGTSTLVLPAQLLLLGPAETGRTALKAIL